MNIRFDPIRSLGDPAGWISAEGERVAHDHQQRAPPE